MNPNVKGLFRYNYRILIGNTYWLLVIPIAVSQLVTVWHMSMAAAFQEYRGAQLAELVAPLLGAFLSSHILGNEYRSHIGAIIISKPLHIGKIVFFRLIAIYLFVGFLVGVSMAICHFGIHPFNLGEAFLAGLPSTIYLSLLSMTFAALFRHPMIGFLLAAFVWILDLIMGFSFHPLLSLQGLAALWGEHPLKEFFWANKAALLIASALLYLLHKRVMLTVAEPENRKRTARRVGWVMVFLFLYIYSGAAGKIIYGLRQKGHLPGSDIIWYRKEFMVYDPAPVAWLFGRAFAYYIGYLPPWIQTQDSRESFVGETKEHLAQLQWVADNAPHSIWADSSLYVLATLKRRGEDIRSSLELFRRLVTDYPKSPFASLALEDMGRNSAERGDTETARWAFSRILTDYPSTPSVLPAARFMVGDLMDQDKPEEAARAAHTGEAMASPYDRPAWIIQAAELLVKAGQTEKALAEYRRAGREAQAALELLDRRAFQGTQLQESNIRDKLKEIQAVAEKAASSQG